jgi:hypothetical protein
MRKTTGISLMVLIFLSLCLITFSLLSVSSASADTSLAQMSAERTTQYYQAVTDANELLAQIDAFLIDCYLDAQEASDPESAYYTACSALPDSLTDLTWEEDTITFTVPVTDQQVLQAALTPVWPDSPEDAFYRITTWKICNTTDWTPDTSQNLYRTDTDTLSGIQ